MTSLPGCGSTMRKAAGSRCQERRRSGPLISPSALQPEVLAGDADLPGPQVQHVVALLVVAAAQLPRRSRSGRGDRSRTRSSRRALPSSGSASGVISVPPPTLEPLPTATIKHVLVQVGDDLAVGLDPQPDERRLDGGQRGPDRVAQLAEGLPTPSAPSRSFQRAPRRLAWALAPACTLLTTTSPSSSTMQVDRARRRRTGRRRRLGGVERDAQAAGEVVAGAERDQRQRRPGRSCRRCSAETTACRLPSPPATTIRREPARCRTPSSSPGLLVAAHLDVRVLAQDPEGVLQRLLLGAAGVAVGDEQERIHGPGNLAGSV